MSDAERPSPERILPEPEPDPDDLPRDEVQVAQELERALELFNAGEYHAAHEVLDRLWLATQGAESDFFKGLIQASIALHHFERANVDGARSLYTGHRRCLAAYLPGHRGLDLAGFLDDMQRALRPALRARPGERPVLEPEGRPQLRKLEDG